MGTGGRGPARRGKAGQALVGNAVMATPGQPGVGMARHGGAVLACLGAARQGEPSGAVAVGARPGAASPQFDAYGRLSSLKQAGWQIVYLSYTHALDRDLPSRIALNSPGLKIKVVVYAWK